MAVTIREMRIGDIEAVVRAVEQAGVAVERAHVVNSLSLIACADGEGQATADVPGSVLCVKGEHGDVSLEVIFNATPAAAALVRQLIDKALAKVQAAAIRTCRIRVHGDLPSESDPLSTGSNWFARFERDQAA